MKVQQGDGTKKRKEEEEEDTARRVLQAVEVGFMVCGKDRDVCLLTSLSNCDR